MHLGSFLNVATFLCFRYAELLIKNPLLVDYIDEILRDERLSLNDPVIANFIEIYYPKVCMSANCFFPGAVA